MKTLEELNEELKKYETIQREYTFKIQDIRNEILARKEDRTNKYVGKYLRAYRAYDNGLDYSKYVYVTSAEKECGVTSFYLKGYCFTTYFSDEYKRQTFVTDGIGIRLTDIEDGFYELEEITKEQFYEARDKALKKIMEEKYE